MTLGVLLSALAVFAQTEIVNEFDINPFSKKPNKSSNRRLMKFALGLVSHEEVGDCLYQ